MQTNDVPDIVVGRLPLYLRTLEQLDCEGTTFVSSQELAKRTFLNPAQIRKDLSFFGEFGKQGTGYDIRYLCNELRQILHLGKEWAVALVGFGNLGRAIANYKGFIDRGFRITHIFESDIEKIGAKISNGLEVLDIQKMPEIIARHGIQIAMMTTPASSAQEIADILVKAGVKAILNYAPVTLDVPEHVRVQHIDPAIYLQHMTYYLKD